MNDFLGDVVGVIALASGLVLAGFIVAEMVKDNRR